MPLVRRHSPRRLAALAMGAAALALAANTVLPWWPHECPHHAAMAAAAAPVEAPADPAPAEDADPHADHHDHAAHLAALAAEAEVAAAEADPHAGHHGHHEVSAPAHHGHAAHADGPGVSAPCFGAGGGHGDSEVPCTCDGRMPPVADLPTSVVLLPTTGPVLATLAREVARPLPPAATLPRRSFPPHSLPLAQAPPRAG